MVNLDTCSWLLKKRADELRTAARDLDMIADGMIMDKKRQDLDMEIDRLERIRILKEQPPQAAEEKQ